MSLTEKMFIRKAHETVITRATNIDKELYQLSVFEEVETNKKLFEISKIDFNNNGNVLKEDIEVYVSSVIAVFQFSDKLFKPIRTKFDKLENDNTVNGITLLINDSLGLNIISDKEGTKENDKVLVHFDTNKANNEYFKLYNEIHNTIEKCNLQHSKALIDLVSEIL